MTLGGNQPAHQAKERSLATFSILVHGEEAADENREVERSRAGFETADPFGNSGNRVNVAVATGG